MDERKEDEEGVAGKRGLWMGKGEGSEGSGWWMKGKRMNGNEVLEKGGGGMRWRKEGIRM